MIPRNTSGVPGFLASHTQLRRQYLRDVASAAQSAGCNWNCKKSEIDRKYARLADKATLAMNNKKR